MSPTNDDCTAEADALREHYLLAVWPISQTAEAEQDKMRLDDLVQRHGLPYVKRGSRYRFEEEEFTARGLREALAFAEGFDRARQGAKKAP
jgi:hypothetical protein